MENVKKLSNTFKHNKVLNILQEWERTVRTSHGTKACVLEATEIGRESDMRFRAGKMSFRGAKTVLENLSSRDEVNK